MNIQYCKVLKSQKLSLHLKILNTNYRIFLILPIVFNISFNIANKQASKVLLKIQKKFKLFGTLLEERCNSHLKFIKLLLDYALT